MGALLERLMPLLLRLDGMLQRIVPPIEARVAWVSHPDYAGNAFHLYRHLATSRPGVEHVWLVVDRAAGERIEDDVDRIGASFAPATTVRVVQRHSLRGYWARLRSRRIFHTHGVYPMDVAHGRDVVSLWHGMPIKCIGALNTVSPDPHPTFGTLHVATSSFFRYVIASAFDAPIDRVLWTGLPRCDVLARPHPLAPSPATVRAEVGVPAGDRMVVWLPTYRAGGRAPDPAGPGARSFLDDLPDGALGWVDASARAEGCTVIVKLHPDDPTNRDDRDLGTTHVRLLRSPDWLATGIELYDLLAVSDALITDISSVLIDYLVTDRPIGMLGFDDDAYDRDLVFPVRAVRGSRRVDDLDTERAVADFFARVGGGETVPALGDDLSPWLYDAPRGEGCDSVLAAVGL